MTAYELADDLESYDWYYEHEVTGSDGFTQEIKTCNTEYVWDAASMLRQQADRIAHLEMLLANRNEIIDKLDLTTPQIKELSDEEIYKLAGEFWIEGSFDDGELDYVGFARAILKKASEK